MRVTVDKSGHPANWPQMGGEICIGLQSVRFVTHGQMIYNRVFPLDRSTATVNKR